MPGSELKATAQNKLPGIFISYRRSDTPDAVGRIYDRLVSEFGKARVFKDVDSIPLGQDFRGHLNDIVGGCAAVLAIIGPKWTDIRNEAGLKRLEDPDDFVRIELEAALARDVPVVPVLVGHAPMPSTSQLPSTLSSLAFRQSIEVRPDPDFHNDATRLVSALRAIIDPNAPLVEPLSGKPKRSWVPWLVGLAAATTLAAIAFAIPALRYLHQAPPTETRVDIVTPATNDPASFALSPDGRYIAFVADAGGASSLWLRSLATTTAQRLAGTDGAYMPFWSPNSQSIGFFANGMLKRMDLGGGAPMTLAPVLAGRGGTWNADGVILFSRNEVSPLKRVSASGGDVTDVTTIAPGQIGHISPQFLPDGVHFLYVILGGSSAGIYLGALGDSAPVRLVNADSAGAYHPLGWLLWMRSGVLLAQRLDVARAKLIGEPVTVAEGFDKASTFRPCCSFSSTGWLAYRTGSTGRRQLTWVDRSGAVAGTIGDPDATYYRPRISPNGRRVAVERRDQGNSDIWLLEGDRRSPFTLDEARHNYPVWSSDGTRIAYRSSRSGVGDIYQKFADGSGQEEKLAANDVFMNPTSQSRDGRFLMYFTVDSKNAADLWILPLTGDRKPRALLATSMVEGMGEFSPTGEWFAYESESLGLREVFVRHFGRTGDSDSAAGAQWRVSTGGGMTPRWRPDGKELYFLDRSGSIMAAPISVNGNSLTPGTPVRLFPTRIVGGGTDPIASGQYDVAPNGRFLINTLQESDATPITLIQNWNPDAGK